MINIGDLSVQRSLSNGAAFWCLAAIVLLTACQVTTHGLNPTQIAMLKKEGFQQTNDGWALALSSKVLFDVDADAIKPETRQSIERTGQALASVQITRLRVEGYTDNTGSDTHNIDLSRRRAAAVEQALASSGLAGGRIQIEGFGKQNPVADNATEAGRAENRRVAIIVPSIQD
jgi:outer membrane protein OmpA-like peptidoglycan-associated protein